MPARAPRDIRKRVFGRDPATYDRVRLGYPDRVWEVLTRRCGLGPGCRVFEIGPGTGIATRGLLQRGAGPVTLIEPDRRMARYLAGALGPRGDRATIQVVPFERARLPDGEFDLGVAATSFHWLPERPALRRVARALRSGGWWATWNHHHGDPYRPSPFHQALQPLYRELSPRGNADRYTRRTDLAHRRGRLRALRATDRFDRISLDPVRWTVTLSTERVVALWGTFSEIATLPPRPRVRFLSGLRRIAEEQFHGRVTFPMQTPVYTARRV